MNKKIIFPLAILFASSAVVAKVDSLKVAYYNAESAIMQSKYGKQAAEKIQKTQQDLTSQFKSAQDSYEKEVQNYQKQSSVMSLTSREEKEKELLNKKNELETKAKSFDDQVKLEYRQMQARSYEQLTKAALEWGKTNGFDMVRAVVPGPDVIINADKIEEVTKEISNLIDKNNPSSKVSA